MYGEIAAQSSLFGVESIKIGHGDREAEAVVGDAVMVQLPGQTTTRPCRLEAIVFHEESDGGGRLLARVQRFARYQGKKKYTPPLVWEITNDPRTVELDRLVELCEVIPAREADGHARRGLGPVYQCAGFAEQLSGSKIEPIPSPDPKVKHLPWRREGHEKMFFDRRKSGVNWNREPGRRVCWYFHSAQR